MSDEHGHEDVLDGDDEHERDGENVMEMEEGLIINLNEIIIIISSGIWSPSSPLIPSSQHLY